MRDDRCREPIERAGTGMVGPLHRQVDDAPVKPSPGARRVRIEFPDPGQIAEARSALSQVGYVIPAGTANTLELTVDGDGMELVREVAARLGGRIHTGQ